MYPALFYLGLLHAGFQPTVNVEFLNQRVNSRGKDILFAYARLAAHPCRPGPEALLLLAQPLGFEEGPQLEREEEGLFFVVIYVKA